MDRNDYKWWAVIFSLIAIGVIVGLFVDAQAMWDERNSSVEVSNANPLSLEQDNITKWCKAQGFNDGIIFSKFCDGIVCFNDPFQIENFGNSICYPYKQYFETPISYGGGLND